MTPTTHGDASYSTSSSITSKVRGKGKTASVPSPPRVTKESNAEDGTHGATEDGKANGKGKDGIGKFGKSQARNWKTLAEMKAEEQTITAEVDFMDPETSLRLQHAKFTAAIGSCNNTATARTASVLLLQFPVLHGGAAIQRFVETIEYAFADGSVHFDAVILPENYFKVGYFLNEQDGAASPREDGRIPTNIRGEFSLPFSRIEDKAKELAARYKTTIILGTVNEAAEAIPWANETRTGGFCSENDNRRFTEKYKTSVVVGPRGERLLKYRKREVHEGTGTRSGAEIGRFRWPIVRNGGAREIEAGVLICLDADTLANVAVRDLLQSDGTDSRRPPVKVIFNPTNIASAPLIQALSSMQSMWEHAAAGNTLSESPFFLIRCDVSGGAGGASQGAGSSQVIGPLTTETVSGAAEQAFAVKLDLGHLFERGLVETSEDLTDSTQASTLVAKKADPPECLLASRFPFCPTNSSYFVHPRTTLRWVDCSRFFNHPRERKEFLLIGMWAPLGRIEDFTAENTEVTTVVGFGDRVGAWQRFLAATEAKFVTPASERKFLTVLYDRKFPNNSVELGSAVAAGIDSSSCTTFPKWLAEQAEVVAQETEQGSRGENLEISTGVIVDLANDHSELVFRSAQQTSRIFLGVGVLRWWLGKQGAKEAQVQQVFRMEQNQNSGLSQGNALESKVIRPPIIVLRGNTLGLMSFRFNVMKAALKKNPPKSVGGITRELQCACEEIMLL